VAERPIPPRRILALALPALGALAADPVLSLVDTAFVGRIGPVELAALGVDTAIFSFAFAMFNFLAYATTPMVASARGRGAIAESGRVVQRALVIAVGVGIAAAAVLGLAASLFVRVMQAGPEVLDPAVSYLRIRALAMPALLIITAGHGAYRGFQDTRTPLYVTLAVNGLNGVLDPLLIFGAGMGLEGAAIATVFAQWIGALWFLWLLRRKARREAWPAERVRLSELRPFLAVGSVLILRTVMIVGSLTAATATAARIGTIQVAAHQVVSQLWFLLAMTVDAVAIAAQALVADLAGRGDERGARSLSNLLLWWGLWLGVGLGAVLFLARGALGAVFTDDAAVLAAIEAVVPIAAAMQPVAAVVFVFDGIFLAVLAIRLLALSTGAGLAAALAVLGATLAGGWGLDGVWWAITAMVLARGAVLAVAYRSGTTLSRA
jgi:MATE family multidrug resistance protein